ncbi:MAG: serine kinase [Bacteroidales bacterium]|jgi:predicted transcriptional regulator|nr:serine kinase [Bacteroidales bacterium]MCB9028873.1 serine kinase [Bacteroidales bacterium]MDD3735540.1 DRTGG domain-containing protein [Bacteroidales bacterium]NLD64272.1 serine kinase [Bacteroidales bacterium]HNT92675.1 DRTGG domain-containing protein [Bacteroidales bacterium]
MKVTDIVEKLNLKIFSGHDGLGREVTGGYASDLLSDVMGHATAGSAWITIQTHRNVVAIASLRDLSAVIITCGEKPGDDTVSQSNEESIPVLGTDLPTFEIAGRLYSLIS